MVLAFQSPEERVPEFYWEELRWASRMGGPLN